MARLILDTGAIIALERMEGTDGDRLADDADVAICAATAAELLVGIELADESHRAQRRRFVLGVIERAEILDYDLEVAQCHAALLAYTRRSGTPRGAHDLQIAATARATGRTVLTTDKSAFGGLPGVRFELAG